MAAGWYSVRGGGSKNLAIMDADGSNVRPLTEGKWTDTMADWLPDRKWIVFASDRGGDFEIWRIKPDGTDLHQIVGRGGRTIIPISRADGRWIVCTSRRAGISAEEISLPHQPQPYGNLFAVRLDGTGLIRLTHNGFEEGNTKLGDQDWPRTSSPPLRTARRPGMITGMDQRARILSENRAVHQWMANNKYLNNRHVRVE